MLELCQLSRKLAFPHPRYALNEPNGLLAFGGDLSAERLALAYQNGIFPWFNEGEPILWWSPDPRGVLILDDFHCSRSLQKFIRKHAFRVTLNHNFYDVIQACATVRRGPSIEEQDLQTASAADVSQTWITGDMISAYQQLHDQGFAHSIEIWDEGELVGGLYGIALGGVFCGESMFHYAANASKLAMASLVTLMKNSGMHFIDCQLPNPHLDSLGCTAITRNQFLDMLYLAQDFQVPKETWVARDITDLSKTL